MIASPACRPTSARPSGLAAVTIVGIESLDATTFPLIQIGATAWQARLKAGLLRFNVRTVLAQNRPVRPEEMTTLREYVQQVTSGLDVIADLLDERAPPDLRNALAAARSSFSGSAYSDLRREVETSAASGRPLAGAGVGGVRRSWRVATAAGAGAEGMPHRSAGP